ncbi:epoxide hydrolase family protein [Actinoplanes sp. NPDC049596]|uniref:epoxide hydrolase family protein n=1 Tax=unclassified Actinoplanes TaxID=2626549 RepID=UPI00342AC3CF
MTSAPQPFRPTTAPAALDDLRRRLRATRWPSGPAGAGWSLGADQDYLRDLIAYWADGYDWPAREAALAEPPRYRMRLGTGSEVTFRHVRAASPGPALPLILSHGWPDSSWRYHKVIGLLTDPAAHGGDPADAFDVVIPDMPGFGHSPAPVGAALDSIAVAGLWAELMRELGYARYGAAGGDIGSSVSRFLALDHREHVVAVHRMDAGLPVLADTSHLSGEELAWLAEVSAWGAAEGAYAAMHRTKPQTAAAGLSDSPAGLAAWIVEKLRSWSDCHGDLATVFTRDDVLDLLSVAWFTNSIGPSMTMYHANAAIPAAQHARRVEVPSGFSLFPGDLVRPPRAWLERNSAVVRVTEPRRGGHFAPYEQPEIYAQELRDFFRPFRGDPEKSSAVSTGPQPQ